MCLFNKPPTLVKGYQNRREEQRHNIYTPLPVNIVDAQTHVALACRVDDVSREGLGIETDTALPIGHELILVTLRERFHLVVSWCEKVDGCRRYRAGLHLTDPRQDLGKVFASFFKGFQAS